MLSMAIRAWYWAIGVNSAPAGDVRAAQTPSTEVRMCSPTTIPIRSRSMPSSSSRSASTFGTRPDASSTSVTRSSREPSPSLGATVATIASPSRETLFTRAERMTSMPSASSAAWRTAAACSSERGEMRSGDWTSVTREPNRAKIWANSRPTGPAPTTSSDSGSSVRLERGDVVDPVDLLDPFDRWDGGA